ncbi:MAG: hypothetical protein ABEI53_03645 [Candidatus Magasanikbacteria bacterium]
MGSAIELQGHLPSLLKRLAEECNSKTKALAEHVQNCLDEHKERGESRSCEIIFTIRRKKIEIFYPYGMTLEDFDDSFKRIGKSPKRQDPNKIGRHGTGIFKFMKLGNKLTFYSRKNEKDDGIEVTLREGSEKAEVNSLKKRDLRCTGIKIVISELHTKGTYIKRSQLEAALQREFGNFIRREVIKIKLDYPSGNYVVDKPEFDLPPLAENWGKVAMEETGNPIEFELYYDPSEKGEVTILEPAGTGIESISEVEKSFGLHDTVWTSGKVSGFIHTSKTKLKPVNSRENFLRDNSWNGLVLTLHKLQDSLEAEIEKMEKERERQKRSQLRERSIDLAREILDDSQFEDLDLPGRVNRKNPSERYPEGGFGFVVPSVKIHPEDYATTPFKVELSEVESGSLESIEFKILDDEIASVEPKKIKLKEDQADDGLFSITLKLFSGSKEGETILVARTENNQREDILGVKVGPKTSRGNQDRGGEAGVSLALKEDRLSPASLHSEVLKGQERAQVVVNSLNPHYEKIMEDMDDEEWQVFYNSLLLIKEALFLASDRNEEVKEFFERFLYAQFELLEKNLL